MYDKVLIQGYQHLIGDEIPFENIDCFGLKPGEYIIQVGKETSGCSIETRFDYPAKYAGRIKIDETNFAAFQVDEKEVHGFNLFYPQRPVYVLFVILEEHGELLHPNFRNLTPCIHKGIFIKVSK